MIRKNGYWCAKVWWRARRRKELHGGSWYSSALRCGPAHALSIRRCGTRNHRHTHTHTHTLTMRFKLSEPVNNLPSHGTKGTRHSSSPLTPPALVPLRHARAQGAADLGHVNPKPSNQNPKTEARDLWRSALQGLRLSEA